MEIDKVIVTNMGALTSKYGKTMPRIARALDRLVAADRRRGLETRVVALDSPGDMVAVGGKAVTDRKDQKQVKTAVQVSRRVAPLPVAACCTRDVHTGLGVQTKQVLDGDDGNAGH